MLKRISLSTILILLAAGFCWSGQFSPVIDTFEDRNLVDYSSGKWAAESDSAAGGDSTVSVDFVIGAGNSKAALRCDYELGPKFDYRYAMVTLNYAEPRDWSGFKGIKFWLKGSGHKLQVDLCSVGVKDNDYHSFSIESTPAEWREYKVAFSAFKQGGWGKVLSLDPAQINKVQFRASSAAQNESGIFIIDDVNLAVNEDFNFAVKGDEFVLADFEGMLSDAFGNFWSGQSDKWNGGDSAYEVTLVKTKASGKNKSRSNLKFTYELGPSYEYRYALLKDEMQEPIDISAYKTMKFRMRGSGHKIKLHLCTANVEDFDFYEYLIDPSPKEWREYRILFESFKQEGWGKPKPLDLTKLNKIQFQAGSMKAGEAGWFELDDISFSKSSETGMRKFSVYPVKNSDSSGPGCYLGVFGPHYAENPENVKQLETKIGKKFAQVMMFVNWYEDFPAQDCGELAKSGYVPHITWEPWDTARSSAVTLDDIISGKYDAYIKNWAIASKALDRPFFLRWGHEFNGDWFPWSLKKNGADKYIRAYRRVRDIFRKNRADNAVWVWCVNGFTQPSVPENDLLKAYPGDAYVDWLAFNGYNFGSQPGIDSGWRSFEELFTPVYALLLRSIPDKPIMIGEFASGNIGGDKGAWLLSAAASLRKKFPAIRSVIWFNMQKEADWRVDGDPDTADAFHKAVSNSYFLSSPEGLLASAESARVNRAKHLEALRLLPYQEKKLCVAERAGSRPVVDGELDDWRSSDNSIKLNEENVSIGSIMNSGDSSAKIDIKWDNKSLYIACNIKDNMPMMNSYKGADSWQGDAVELMLGLNPGDNPGRINFSADDVQLLLNPGNGKDKKPFIWNFTKRIYMKGEIAVVKNDNGYIIETSIPFSQFKGFKPAVGKQYSLNIALDDADDGGTRKSQSVWSGSRDFSINPALWGKLELKE